MSYTGERAWANSTSFCSFAAGTSPLTFRLIGVVLLVLAVACSASGAAPSKVSGCIRVDRVVLEVIANGLTVTGGGTLRDGWAVPNPAAPGSHFVAAVIDGAGIGSGTVGVWATPLGPGGSSTGSYIGSIDANAEEFSHWGKPQGVIAATPGVREAKECVKAHK